MSATGAEAGAPAPLPAAELPPAVARLLAGPTPMKLMAAKGMAPLRPAELLTAIYQLSFDADAGVRAAAEASVLALPDNLCAPPLGEALPAAVIDLFARALPPDRTAPLERILYNPATADATFVQLARRLRERELEVIFQNEERLLRCPAILEALYQNPAARMSSVNRAIELLARNGVRADGIPAFDEVAKSIIEDPAALAPEADATFAGVLGSSEDELDIPELDALEPEVAAEAEPQKKAEEPAKKKSAVIDFGKLKLYEKIRLATLGNAYCRKNLMRDPNRMVALAAIRSPRITDSEVVTAAGNRSVSEDVIRYIGNQRDFTKNYAIRLALLHNPKCPVALSLKFLPLLNAEDLKNMARSKNVPSVLSTGARRIIANKKAD